MSGFSRTITLLSLLVAMSLLVGSLEISCPRSIASQQWQRGVFAPIIFASDNASADQAQGNEHGKSHHKKTNAKKDHATSVDLDDAIALLKRIHPQLADKIEKLRKHDPKKAESLFLKHYYHRVQWLLRLKARDPQAYELRVTDICYTRQSRELASQILKIEHSGKVKGKHKSAEKHPDISAQVKKLKDQLRAVLSKQLDVRRKLREHELDKMQNQIEKTKQQIAAMAKAKDRLVQTRMDQLLHTHGKKAKDKQDHVNQDDGKHKETT